jgi:hypothetical protein
MTEPIPAAVADEIASLRDQIHSLRLSQQTLSAGETRAYVREAVREALDARPAPVPTADELFKLLAPKFNEQTRLIAKACVQLLREERTDLEGKLDSTAASAASDSRVARGVAESVPASSATLLRSVFGHLATGSADIPNSVEHVMATAATAVDETIFRRIDSVANRVKVSPPLPRGASAGQIAARMAQGRDSDPEAVVAQLRHDIPRRLQKIEDALQLEEDRIHHLGSIIDHIQDGTPLARSIDPALALAARTVRESSNLIDTRAIVSGLRSDWRMAKDGLDDYSKRMLPRWRSAADTAVHRACADILEKTAAVSGDTRLRTLAVEQRELHRTAQLEHRQRYGRGKDT